MLGLPYETDEDIIGIANLAQSIVDLFYSLPTRQKGTGVSVTVSAACFVPKSQTPFQYEPQDTRDELERKQKLLLSSVKSKKITVKYHDSQTSFLEAVLARGDRRIGKAIYSAWKNGSRLDGWNEHFSFERWTHAFEDNNIDPSFYAFRRRDYDEVMPWGHLDFGVSEDYLISENKKARSAVSTPNCRECCSACGAVSLCGEGKCVCR
jgi:radical SAM superfamily enzyme YgiQ (UPF0313 family)